MVHGAVDHLLCEGGVNGAFIGQRSGKSGKPRTVKSIFLYVKGEAERRVKKGSQDQMREREILYFSLYFQHTLTTITLSPWKSRSH
jgi:hypothetical protein